MSGPPRAPDSRRSRIGRAGLFAADIPERAEVDPSRWYFVYDGTRGTKPVGDRFLSRYLDRVVDAVGVMTPSWGD